MMKIIVGITRLTHERHGFAIRDIGVLQRHQRVPRIFLLNSSISSCGSNSSSSCFCSSRSFGTLSESSRTPFFSRSQVVCLDGDFLHGSPASTANPTATIVMGKATYQITNQKQQESMTITPCSRRRRRSAIITTGRSLPFSQIFSHDPNLKEGILSISTYLDSWRVMEMIGGCSCGGAFRYPIILHYESDP